MKKIIFLFLLIPLSLNAAVVSNNSTNTSSEDSLAFVFYSLDSLGNSTVADSLFILVTGPNGAVTYKDSMAVTNNRITSTIISSKQFYSFKEQVSNLDGVGLNGVYSITLLAYKSSSALLTPNEYNFQIISSSFAEKISSIGDSVNVKGGIIDSSMIASSVWNSPKENHSIGNTFGKFLDTEVSGISSGGGAYSVTIVAYDSVNNMVIPNTGISIRNLSQSSLLATGVTDIDGEVHFNLDAGNMVVVPFAYGWNYKAYDTLVVTGSQIDTVYGSMYDPGAPVSPILCRLYGWLYGIDGTPESGVEVTAVIPGSAVRYSAAIISPYLKSTTTDSMGYFYFDLVPSDSLKPSNTKYEISINKKNGTILRQRISVPVESSWLLTW